MPYISEQAGRVLHENEASASGIREVQLEPGADDNAGIVVGGKGANLGGHAMPLAVPLNVRCDTAANFRTKGGQ